ncbi:37S ribosomal protein S17 mitochondrial [Gaertneriomyces sp. JEL0708]|nr:37S ribosomal protein S17 mitochondrial [Gaertneriomyces sp. JEL0708]
MSFCSTTVLLNATVRTTGQSFLGEVVGTAMQRTIKVRVARVKIHPKVQKPVTYHKNFLVHDAEEKCVIGDWVRIDSCQKLSKRKNFTLGEIVTPAARYYDDDGKLHTQRKASVADVDKVAIQREAQELFKA